MKNIHIAVSLMISSIQVAGFCGTNALALEEFKTPSPKLIQGEISARSEEISFLAEIGISCTTVTGHADVFLVTEVAPASTAFRSGIAMNDRITAIQSNSKGFKLVVERGGKLYQVKLTKMVGSIAQPENGIAEISIPPLKVPVVNVGMHPVPVVDIRPTGVMQSHYPDCFYEGDIAALATTPRGRKLLASMIFAAGKDSYIVKFPGGDSVQVSPRDVYEYGLQNPAGWASVLEVALLKHYDIRAIVGRLAGDGTPAIKIAFELLTGKPAQAVHTDSLPPAEITKFLRQALTAGFPVAVSTKNTAESHAVPVLTGNHCYTLMGYDAASDSAILRNCYGIESSPPAARAAGVLNMGNGVVKVPVSLFPTYIRFISYPSF
jgi:hypothetical protein